LIEDHPRSKEDKLSGPPPKPTALRVLEGNPARRPLPRNEYQPPRSDDVPEPPWYLNERAAAEWRRVAPLLFHAGVLTSVDTAVFASYCYVYDLWLRAVAVENDARKSRDRAMQIQIGRVISQLTRDLLLVSKHFGMTPSSRSRVSVISSLRPGRFDGLVVVN
jgi:P27 family predicted phage terminase small subunit